MHRRYIATAALLFGLAPALAPSAHAALPAEALYEGVLTSAGGTPAADGEYQLTFALYETDKGGTAAWSEGPVKVQVVGGHLVWRLGSSKALNGAALAALKQQWLGVTVGGDPELPRQRLASSIFALVAGTAADLACTGCVSVSEMKFDGDIDLAGGSIKAKNGTFSGDILASTVTASAFVGDGSKLTGLKTPAGSCSKQGEVVKGIKPDGSLLCVSTAGSFPPDSIANTSNGAVSNVFVDAVGPATKIVPIPDNTGATADSIVTVPDLGTVRDLQIHVKVQNTDLSAVSMKVFPPNDKSKGWVLCDPCGKVDAKSLDQTWSVKAPPKSGDIGQWVGKDAKGLWTLQVLDTSFCVPQKPGNKALCDVTKGNDGFLEDWAVKVETLSNQKIHDPKGRVYARIATASAEALASGKQLTVDTLTNNPALIAQAWLWDGDKKRWLPAATGVDQAAGCSSCGNGSDGDYKPSSSASLAGKVYQFKDFIIPKGVTIKVTGSAPLHIKATGKVEILGTLDLQGAPGQDVKPGVNGCSGNTSCSEGGVGGAGASAGGAGGKGCYGQSGTNGSGLGGGKRGNSSSYGSGGGGGGYGTSGAIAVSGSSGQTPGAGGPTYSGVHQGTLIGGSGGGAGAYGSAYNSGGTGGGGGGGAVRIDAPSVRVGGTINANGGRGGTMSNNCDGGGGGGGSGGGVWIRSASIDLSGGTVTAQGGARGETIAGHSSDGGDGGKGGDGQVRLDSPAKVIGSTAPTYQSGDVAGLGTSLNPFVITQPVPGKVLLTNSTGQTHKVRLVVTF